MSEETTEKDVLLEYDGHVATITLNRPDVRNAIRRKTYDELNAALYDAADNARAVIITGAGKAFCSGDDVRMLASRTATDGPIERRIPTLTNTADVLLNLNIPIIAAVNGAAVGWGMELSLMADFRIASEHAKFGELFVKRGILPDVAGLGRLAQLVGREKAAEILMLGNIFDAAEAQRIGMVGQVVGADDLLPTARNLAAELASRPPLAISAIKQGLRRAVDPEWSTLGRWFTETLWGLFQTADHREGVASFLEKREPVFRGE